MKKEISNFLEDRYGFTLGKFMDKLRKTKQTKWIEKVNVVHSTREIENLCRSMELQCVYWKTIAELTMELVARIYVRCKFCNSVNLQYIADVAFGLDWIQDWYGKKVLEYNEMFLTIQESKNEIYRGYYCSFDEFHRFIKRFGGSEYPKFKRYWLQCRELSRLKNILPICNQDILSWSEDVYWNPLNPFYKQKDYSSAHLFSNQENSSPIVFIVYIPRCDLIYFGTSDHSSTYRTLREQYPGEKEFKIRTLYAYQMKNPHIQINRAIQILQNLFKEFLISPDKNFVLPLKCVVDLIEVHVPLVLNNLESKGPPFQRTPKKKDFNIFKLNEKQSPRTNPPGFNFTQKKESLSTDQFSSTSSNGILRISSVDLLDDLLMSNEDVVSDTKGPVQNVSRGNDVDYSELFGEESIETDKIDENLIQKDPEKSLNHSVKDPEKSLNHSVKDPVKPFNHSVKDPVKTFNHSVSCQTPESSKQTCSVQTQSESQTLQNLHNQFRKEQILQSSGHSMQSPNQNPVMSQPFHSPTHPYSVQSQSFQNQLHTFQSQNQSYAFQSPQNQARNDPNASTNANRSWPESQNHYSLVTNSLNLKSMKTSLPDPSYLISDEEDEIVPMMRDRQTERRRYLSHYSDTDEDDHVLEIPKNTNLIRQVKYLKQQLKHIEARVSPKKKKTNERRVSITHSNPMNEDGDFNLQLSLRTGDSRSKSASIEKKEPLNETEELKKVSPTTSPIQTTTVEKPQIFQEMVQKYTKTLGKQREIIEEKDKKLREANNKVKELKLEIQQLKAQLNMFIPDELQTSDED